MLKGRFPDVTPIQIIAAIKFALTMLVANTLITNDTGKKWTMIAGMVVPAVMTIADSIIRLARNVGNAVHGLPQVPPGPPA